MSQLIVKLLLVLSSIPNNFVFNLVYSVNFAHCYWSHSISSNLQKYEKYHSISHYC